MKMRVILEKNNNLANAISEFSKRCNGLKSRRYYSKLEFEISANIHCVGLYTIYENFQSESSDLVDIG